MGNFRLGGRHTANYVCGVISRVVSESLGRRVSDYFVSYSATVNKADIRKYMNNDRDDDYWFPCSVHFCQLAVKEAVTSFLIGRPTTQDCASEISFVDWDDLDEQGIITHSTHLQDISSFELIKPTERAVLATLRRSHARNTMFLSIQLSNGIRTEI